jgi:ankyrin repeat protein
MANVLTVNDFINYEEKGVRLYVKSNAIKHYAVDSKQAGFLKNWKKIKSEKPFLWLFIMIPYYIHRLQREKEDRRTIDAFIAAVKKENIKPDAAISSTNINLIKRAHTIETCLWLKVGELRDKPKKLTRDDFKSVLKIIELPKTNSNKGGEKKDAAIDEDSFKIDDPIVNYVLNCNEQPQLDLDLKLKIYKWASKYGHTEVLRKLVSRYGGALKQADIQKSLGCHPIVYAVKNNHQFKALEELLSHFGTDGIVEEALNSAIESNNLKILKVLLGDQRFVGLANYYAGKPLEWAASEGRLDVLKLLLKEEEHIGKAVLERAIIKNRVEIVKRLLDDERLELSDEDKKSCLLLAAEYDHENIVELFLKDKNVSFDGVISRAVVRVSENQNASNRSAANRGYIKLVERLLKDKRVTDSLSKDDIKFIDKRLKSCSVSCKAFDDLKVFLETFSNNKNVMFSSNDLYWVTQFAVQAGKINFVNALLKDKRVDLIELNMAICVASENGQLGVVKLLLADKRVDPTVNNNKPIKKATQNGYPKVVKALLGWRGGANGEKKVDPTADDNNNAITIAKESDFLEILVLLIDTLPENKKREYDEWVKKNERTPAQKKVFEAFNDADAVNKVEALLEDKTDEMPVAICDYVLIYGCSKDVFDILKKDARFLFHEDVIKDD